MLHFLLLEAKVRLHNFVDPKREKPTTLRPRLTRFDLTRFSFLLLAATFSICAAHSQEVEKGLLRVGGFRCASLKSLGNDPTLDLYHTGYWNYTGFRMEVWRRLGVPFWYRQGTGVVRIAGEGWRPDLGDDVSSAEAGGRASEEIGKSTLRPKRNLESHDEQVGAPSNAIDKDKTTSWHPPDDVHSGTLIVNFAANARVSKIRFLSDDGPLYTPRDYSVGLILPDGSRREIASISGEYSLGGTWREFPVAGVESKGIYIDASASNDGNRSPAISEFEAKGEFVEATKPTIYPANVSIPMAGYAGQELHFIGNVGSGFPTTPDLATPVGDYLIHYSNGQTEDVPLIAGTNVADIEYGNFVPEAEFAFGLNPYDPPPGKTAYHLDEQLPVDLNHQLMMFSHRLEHPDWPIQSVEFRCTRPHTTLLLAAVTLEQAGPRISPLFYNGKMVRPYPNDAPSAPTPPLDRLKDHSREISLDGTWSYRTDPGNEGIRSEFFSPAYDASLWKPMPVPSQWYVQGVDYHGVVWFRREIRLPESFTSTIAELNFGAVDYEARVWVNGVYVGRHIGPYASFKVDVTRALRRGATNVIVVRVDCPLDPGYEKYKTLIEGNATDDIITPAGREGSMGGICGSVVLRGRGELGIEDLWATTDLSSDLKHADVAVKFVIENASRSGRAEVRVTLTEPERSGFTARVFEATTLAKLDSGQIPVEVSLSIENPLLWYPWEQGMPYLHILKVEVFSDGEVSDTRFIRVGLRQVEFNEQGHYVLVNHHRIFLKGILNDDVHWRSLMDRRGYSQRIKMQKDANINIIRLIAHQSQEDMYDLCDEMGVMIWQEMPLQWQYSHSQPIHNEILQIARETLVQTRSHASIVGWSAWNEGGQPDFSNRITALIREMDGTRPLTRASGHGEFDVHIYPNMPDSLQRRTSLWTGFKLNFVSETGSYGLSSEADIRAMVGDDFFRFDSADPIWDNFDSYRWSNDPLFPDAPKPAAWPVAKIRQYVLEKINPSQHFYAQYQQFQYENARAQRFDPTTALIHCRFDDAYPLAYSGAPVNFDGRPKPGYFAVRNANQAVLPILFFDFEGAKDVRVVNDYWFREWKGAKLTYRLRTREGKILSEATRTFDLPADSTVSVLPREETGDIWHVPGGFFADLSIRDAEGTLLSENHYDLTAEEVQTFLTSVYPLAPVTPANAVLLTADQAIGIENVKKEKSEGGTYSHELLKISPSAGPPQFGFVTTVPTDGNYYLRVSASSGKAAHYLVVMVDGVNAPRERYETLNPDGHLTRDVHSTPDISWYPGWTVWLKKGEHKLLFTVPKDHYVPDLLFDAVALQNYKNRPEPFFIPGTRDVESEGEVGAIN
jgi:beta-mannosidase